MDNQHRKIKGYRELTHEEIMRMNKAKELEEAVMQFIESEDNYGEGDARWRAIAKTGIQQGFMALGGY